MPKPLSPEWLTHLDQYGQNKQDSHDCQCKKHIPQCWYLHVFPPVSVFSSDAYTVNFSITSIGLLPAVVQHMSALCERWG